MEMGILEIVKFGVHHKVTRIRTITIFGIMWTLLLLSALTLRTLEGGFGTAPSEIITRVITALLLFIFLPLTPLYFYLESKRPDRKKTLNKCPYCGGKISQTDFYKLQLGDYIVCEYCGELIES